MEDSGLQRVNPKCVGVLSPSVTTRTKLVLLCTKSRFYHKGLVLEVKGNEVKGSTFLS